METERWMPGVQGEMGMKEGVQIANFVGWGSFFIIIKI